MPRVFAGIDPGVTGAIALLVVYPDGTQALTVTATPVDWIAVGAGKRRRYAIDRVDELLRTQTPAISLAYLEAQSARPGQGVASTFQTGFGEGMWRGLLTAHAIPHALVTPQRWRKLTGIPAAPKGANKSLVKNAVCQVAARRFPAFPIRLEHADAVMLAVAAALEHDTEKVNGSYA